VKEEENSSPSSNFLFLVESVEPTGASKSASCRKNSSDPSRSISPLTPGVITGEEKTLAALSTEIGLGMTGGEVVESGTGSTIVGASPTETEGSQPSFPFPLPKGDKG